MDRADKSIALAALRLLTNIPSNHPFWLTSVRCLISVAAIEQAELQLITTGIPTQVFWIMETHEDGYPLMLKTIAFASLGNKILHLRGEGMGLPLPAATIWSANSRKGRPPTRGT